jgi:hypothetical protein
MGKRQKTRKQRGGELNFFGLALLRYIYNSTIDAIKNGKLTYDTLKLYLPSLEPRSEMHDTIIKLLDNEYNSGIIDLPTYNLFVSKVNKELTPDSIPFSLKNNFVYDIQNLSKNAQEYAAPFVAQGIDALNTTAKNVQEYLAADPVRAAAIIAGLGSYGLYKYFAARPKSVKKSRKSNAAK